MYSKVRQHATQGLWLSTLVPLLLAQTEHRELSMKMVMATLGLFTFQKDVQITQPFIFCINVFLVTLTFINQSSFVYTSSIVGFIFSFTIALLDIFPYSFSLGEAVLITHLLVIFLIYYPYLLSFFVCYFVVERYSLKFSCRVLSCIGITLICALGVTYYFHSQSVYPIHLLIRRTTCFFSLPCLIVVFSWAALILACVLVTLHQRHITASTVVSEIGDDVGDSSANNTVQNGFSYTTSEQYPRAPVWMRKIFHFCAGAVFISGLLVSPTLLSLASSAVFLLSLLLEWARRRGVSSGSHTSFPVFYESYEAFEEFTVLNNLAHNTLCSIKV